MNVHTPPPGDDLTAIASVMKQIFQGSTTTRGESSGEKYYDPDKQKEELKDKRTLSDGGLNNERWKSQLAPDGKLYGGHPVLESGNGQRICCWGVIDDDRVPRPDVPALKRKAVELNLPLIVMKSKSGGAHLMLRLRAKESPEGFVSPNGWVPQATMHKLLCDARDALGLPKEKKIVQIFPPKETIGNFIWMPYFRGGATCAIDDDGNDIALADFPAHVESLIVTPEEARRRIDAAMPKGSRRSRRDPAERAEAKLTEIVRQIETGELGNYSGRSDHFYGAAGCDMGPYIAAGHIAENVVLARLLAANAASPNPQPEGEARGHIENGIKDGRNKDLPKERDDDDVDAPRLGKVICWTGGETPLFDIEVLNVPGPNNWVKGLTDPDDYRLFRKACVSQLWKMFPDLKRNVWPTILARALEDDREVKPIPFEDTPAGLFLDMLRKFAMRASGDLNDLKMDKPVRIDEKDKLFFKPAALLIFLKDYPVSFGRTDSAVGRRVNDIGEWGVDVGSWPAKQVPIDMPGQMKWVRLSFLDLPGKIPAKTFERPPIT